MNPNDPCGTCNPTHPRSTHAGGTGPCSLCLCTAFTDKPPHTTPVSQETDKPPHTAKQWGHGQVEAGEEGEE